MTRRGESWKQAGLTRPRESWEQSGLALGPRRTCKEVDGTLFLPRHTIEYVRGGIT